MNKERAVKIIKELKDIVGSYRSQFYIFDGDISIPMKILNYPEDYRKILDNKDKIFVLKGSHFLILDDEEAINIIIKGNYLRIFLLIDRPLRIECFKKIFDLIPDEHKYDLFNYVYTDGEFGFKQWSANIINKIKKYVPTEFKQKLKSKVDSSGYLTIYRGCASKSTPVEKAFSWTLDYNKAMFFSKRFCHGNEYNYPGSIYKGQIRLEKIIDYITERDEDEVIALYKDIKILEMQTV